MSDLSLLELEQALEEARRIKVLALTLPADDRLARGYLFLAEAYQELLRDMAAEMDRRPRTTEDMPWWREWQLERGPRPTGTARGYQRCGPGWASSYAGNVRQERCRCVLG